MARLPKARQFHFLPNTPPDRMIAKGTVMILNLEQKMAVANGEPVALNVAGTACVLIRQDIYLRLDPDYESGPWTVEEMNLLADEADELISQGETHGP